MMSQINNIEIIAPNCNQPTHYGEQIRALCLRKQCIQQRALCFKCLLENHQNCAFSIKMLETIPQLLKPFYEIQSEAAKLEPNNFPAQNQLNAKLDKSFMPITKYLQNPSLTNLNELGSFLLENLVLPYQLRILFKNIKKEVFDIRGPSKEPIDVQKQIFDQAQTLFNKGFELNTENQYQQAIICFDEAIKIDPKHYHSFLMKGIALYDLKQFQEAIISFDETLKIKPNYDQAWFWKGKTLYKLSQNQEAISAFEEFLKKNPKDYQVQFMKGHYELSQYQEAIKSFKKAIKIDSKDYAWNWKGKALCKLGQYQDALNCFEEAIKIDIEFSDAWQGKGSALYELHLYQEAIFCFEEVLKMDPQNNYAINYLQKAKENYKN